jgi:uncharacterized protein YjbI with pentapeptide repeats
MVADLSKRIEVHRRWQASRGAEGECLSLIGEDLRGVNLSGAYLLGADLRNANLDGASLARTVLGDAYLSGASLRGADLTEVDLIKSELNHVMPPTPTSAGRTLCGPRSTSQT